ncbi:MAG: hypothetical protein ACRY3E_03925 [Candidatus Lariskella arthropodorum]
MQVKSPFADSSGYMETAKVCYYTEQGIYTCVGTDGQSGEVGICVGGCPRGPIIENHNFQRGGGRIGGFGRGGW